MTASETYKAPGHRPVLLDEVMRLLSPGSGEVYLDCTAGRGGHAAAIAPCLGGAGVCVLCDLDEANLSYASERVKAAAPGLRVEALHASFSEAPRHVAGEGLAADLVLADLGFSSSQMEDPSRGLSFRASGPLDMRFDPSRGPTAADLVNSLSESDLARLIWEYGEERRSRAVARNLVAEREREPITTTERLAEIVRRSVGPRAPGARIDPATRTFQALRISVNDELGHLGSLLDAIEAGARQAGREGGWLARGARIAVISFHSLEDRLVKKAYRRFAEAGVCEVLTRRPVIAGDEEVAQNPRARSARLRVIRLVGTRESE